MARIRSVHPDICASQTMAALTAELERTFVRLWTHCDDEGRCEDRPRLIKAGIYPEHDELTWERVDAELWALSDAGLIVRYEVAGKAYIAVLSWSEYQHPQKPKPSKCPAPPTSGNDPAPAVSRTSTRHVRDTSNRAEIRQPDDDRNPGGHANGSSDHPPRTDPKNPRSKARTVLVRDTSDTSTRLEKEREKEIGEGENTRAATDLPPLALVPTTASSPPATASATGPTDFDAFWALYPRKVAKREATTAWRTARGNANWDTIMLGLRRAIRAWETERRPTDKIPHAATWLRGKRWEDDHDTPPLARAEPKGFAGIRAALENGTL